LVSNTAQLKLVASDGKKISVRYVGLWWYYYTWQNLNLWTIPERIIKEWVFVHYRELACISYFVEAISNIESWKIVKWTQLRISEIIADPKPNSRGFSKK